MNLARRYGLPETGGSIADETVAQRLLCEMGMLKHFRRRSEILGSASRAADSIIDGSDSDFFVIGIYIVTSETDDDGYVAFLLPKSRYSIAAAERQMEEITRQLSGRAPAVLRWAGMPSPD